MSIPETASVLIGGAGPVCLTLASLLGTAGVNTVLVERNPGCVPEPRAVALDGESMRTLQATGLVEGIAQNLKQGFVAEYVNGEGTLLFSTDLRARPYGFCLQNTFDQPMLEQQLLDGLARFACVSVHHSMELIGFEQDEHGVRARVRAQGKQEQSLQAHYMIACDGGRSTVRQSLGIPMCGDRLPQKWLVVDTVDRHLVDDLECRFFCDPARPAMTILRPGGERRWEWMLLEGETDEDLLRDERINALLEEHTDPDQVEVYRKCVYGFSAVVAERFSEGRVFLAGDAAHMTPPFAGQGLNAGVRDVQNLAWKLVRVLDGSLPASLLESYHLERREAAKAVVDLAVMLGDQIQPTDPQAAAERDAMFTEINRDPAAAAAFSRDVIAPLSDVRLPRGWFVADKYGGRMLPQPLLRTPDGDTLLDEAIGPGFTALVMGDVPIPDAVLAHPLWQSLAPRVHRIGSEQAPDSGPTLPADVLDDFLGHTTGRVILLRPDRFVLAELDLDCDPVAPLEELWTDLQERE
jgi:3-(3-hydroxy-phenyl)propionate hydroxylase